MSFYSPNFSFDDISNEEMNVVLVSFDSNVLMEYGVKYKESLQVDLSKYNNFYYNQNSETDSITLTLALVDEYGNPDEWTTDKRRKVVDWMCKDRFCTFISGDDMSIVYYFKCIEYTRKLNHIGHGVIEFVMQPQDQYAYTPVIEQKLRVRGEEIISVDNIDSVHDKYYPKIEIIQFDNNKKDIGIYNLSTSEDGFIMSNILENEKLEIDFEFKSVHSNMNKFRLADINRKWIWLKHGVNEIKIVGDCDIKIITQYALKV